MTDEMSTMNLDEYKEDSDQTRDDSTKNTGTIIIINTYNKNTQEVFLQNLKF